MSTLPSGYTELLYIESTGTQYIDTGFKPNSNTRVVMVFDSITNQQEFYFGARSSMSGSDSFACCFARNTSKLRDDYGSLRFVSDIKPSGKITVNKNKNVTSFSGSSINETTHTHTASTFSCPYNLYLMGCNTAGTANDLATMKLYSCSIYDNGSLVYNLVPCKNESNVIGLYNTISGAFYGNAGTRSLLGYEKESYDLTKSIPSADSLSDGDILNCPYSGAAITIALPKGKFLLECWGSEGGNRGTANKGGKGGYSKGTLTLTAETTTLYLYAGGSGDTGGTGGGFNGGGKRSSYNGGGGGSDIRIGQDSYYARVIVAGGGGSCGAANYAGGAGGGESGESVTQASQGGYGDYGQGGTQTGNGYGSVAASPDDNYNHGGFGFGGYGSYRKSGYGGAGGGGWYGGCGVYPDSSGDDDKGGGGGSGYVYTSTTASNYPSGCLLNSTYYLTDASTTIGTSSFTDYDGTTVTGHSGNGAVRITVIQSDNLQPPTNVTATVTDTRKATITWAASPTSGITGYRIRLSLGSIALLESTLASTRTSYTYNAYEAGTYTFRIEAVKSGKYSQTATTTFTIVGPEAPTNLTYEFQGRSVKLSWDPSTTEGSTYILTGKKAGTTYLTQALEDTTYYADITPASYSFSVVAVLNTIQSSASNTVSFTIESSNNPTNLAGSIDQNGLATITWTKSTSSNVLGYKIYMTAPDQKHVGTSPYGQPLFEFAFSNESLTQNLLELSEWVDARFSYQLRPRVQYTFAIVSYNSTYENPITSSTPKISMSYTTSLDFKSAVIKPNPVYTGELFQLSVGIEETMTPTIVSHM